MTNAVDTAPETESAPTVAELPKSVQEVTWTLPWLAVVVPLVIAALGIAALVSR